LEYCASLALPVYARRVNSMNRLDWQDPRLTRERHRSSTWTFKLTRRAPTLLQETTR
jgi:hypothetical protein